ncbi:hypothetical protein DCS32_13480 [Dokdonia sp. Dokd-P16]|uniref:hypothetical protein n=1 Tax=Dokdonia sp. Dokd-P16 TaxID=2173169 RepID=UPI000D547C6C|nr:hypothetical protein [Dokdonia sp. Dokd-P16]AWH75136.1 hypothetical protein DCS32_13480 [Dokdonia sp. Dokd-P16]
MKNLLIHKNKNLFFSLGIYLFIFFVVPFLYHLANPQAFIVQFQGTRDFSSLIYLFILFVIILISYNLTSFKLPRITLPTIMFNSKLVAALLLVFLVISIYFYINFSFKFRHTGEGLTAAGNDIIVLSLLKIFFKAYLFISLIYYIKSKIILGKWYVYIVIAASFWLSKSASSDIPIILVSLLFGVKKPNLLIQNTSKLNFKLKIFNNLFFRLILILLLGFGIIFMGFANKIGFEKAQEIFFSEAGLPKVFNSTTLRLSTHYASNFGAYKAYEEGSYTITDALSGTWNNMYSRAAYLFSGQAVERDRVWSINRANYLNLFNDNYGEKTGASPGLFASIYYTNNLTIGLILISLYIVGVIKVLKVSLQLNTLKFNLAGYIICALYLMPLFESPFDNINIFNTSFVYLYFTIIPLLKINNDKSLKITSVRNRAQGKLHKI